MKQSEANNTVAARRQLRFICRNDFLFAAFATAVIAGGLIPLRGEALDALVVFAGCLTAAVLIITISARGSLQAEGFPSLVVAVTALQIGLSVCAARLILLRGDAGSIIRFLGNLAVGDSSAAVLVFCIVAAIMFGIICKTVSALARRSSEFADVAGVKASSVDSALAAGLMDQQQALEARCQISRENNFFAAMGGAARFMLFGAIVEIFAIFAELVTSVAMGAASPTSALASAGLPLCGVLHSGASRIYARLVVGAAMATQMSLLVTAVASLWLVRKSMLSAVRGGGNRGLQQDGSKRIKVAANEVSAPKAVERKLQETAEFSQTAPIEAEFVESVSTCAKGGPRLWVWDQIKDNRGYELIADLVENKTSDGIRTMLMAAGGVEWLPVTIPVNVAVGLAKKNKKCVLIDLDVERSAIARVFDIDVDCSDEKVWKKVAATCIGNLRVWPAGGMYKAERNNRGVSLKRAIAALMKRYDAAIIYAPKIQSLSCLEELGGCVQGAFVFGNGEEGGDGGIAAFMKRLGESGCEVIEPVEVLAEAV